MNIPNLPTDSLYKFLAIFGLVLIILSLYLQRIDQDQLLKLDRDYVMEARMLNYDIQAANKKVDVLEARAKRLCAASPCGCRVIKDTEDELGFTLDKSLCPDDLMEALEAIQIQQQTEIAAIKRRRAEIDAKEEMICSIKANYTANKGFTDNLFDFGIMVAGFGFAIWYLFVQRIQDSLLSMQFEKESKTVAKKRSTLPFLRSLRKIVSNK